MQTLLRHRQRRPEGQLSRRGVVFTLSAFLLIAAFAFAAFAIDLGYITMTRGELQKTSDAAALAAVIELGDGFGPGSLLTQAQVATYAKQAAQDVAAANHAGGRSSVYLDQGRDVRLGQYQWDEGSGSWTKNWGAQPYTLAEVTLHRDQVGSSNGDDPLALFFAPVIGHKDANLSIKSTCALRPGTGVRIQPGSGRTADVLPFTLDVNTWDALMAGTGTDSFRYNSDSSVSSGSDGIKEVNLYPNGNQTLPPGNRGTVDFGHSGNSTADIARQILYGLNESDLSHFGGQLDTSGGPMIINGDTGISAGVKDELEAIKGQPRLIPLFSSVSGNGNNANYTIVRFVGVRIMSVQLTGKPTSKHVIIQPAPFVADTVIPGEVTIVQDTYFAPAGLVP
jgi:hypothetical protein